MKWQLADEIKASDHLDELNELVTRRGYMTLGPDPEQDALFAAQTLSVLIGRATAAGLRPQRGIVGTVAKDARPETDKEYAERLGLELATPRRG